MREPTTVTPAVAPLSVAEPDPVVTPEGEAGTGRSLRVPKGVEVEHRSIAALFAAMDDHVEVHEGDVWLSVTSPAFDMSVFEFFWTLGRGMTVWSTDYFHFPILEYVLSARTLVAATGTSLVAAVFGAWATRRCPGAGASGAACRPSR